MAGSLQETAISQQSMKIIESGGCQCNAGDRCLIEITINAMPSGVPLVGIQRYHEITRIWPNCTGVIR
jgi:hypothetical protein